MKIFSPRIGRFFKYEFWPFWLFYAPAYPYGLILALRAKTFTYFTAVNPQLYLGGLLETSKSALLKQLYPEFCPRSLLVSPNQTIDDLPDLLTKKGLAFPLVAKPDKGERGKQVEKIENATQLRAYFRKYRHKKTVLLQEFIDYPIELGVFYHKYPSGGEVEVTSVVQKKFLTIEGDGKHTFADLMAKHERARPRKEYLTKKFADRLHDIVPKGQKICLEPIGNHNRGTTFLNANRLICPEMIEVMAKICRPLSGFYYGRLDLKVRSMADFYAGKGIKVMEINGVNSEPAHIYQPGYPLYRAYKDIYRQMRIVYEISRENHKKGAKYASLFSLLAALSRHFAAD